MLKVILFYGTTESGGPYGFSEQHWFLPSNDFTACELHTKKLVQVRNALMGDGVTFFGFRMSVDGAARTSRFVPSGNLVGPGSAQGSGIANKQATNSDQPNACIVLRATHNNERSKQIYLAGIPDVILRTKPVGPSFTAEPGWSQAFESYRDLLKTGGTWGFKARILNPSSTNIVDYTQQQAGAGFLGIIVTNDIANVGDKVQIRNAKLLNPALPKVNGQYYVTEKAVDVAAGTFTYFLRGTQLLSPDNVGDPGTVEKVEYGPFAYTCIRVSKQGTRKRGVGSLRPVGRSRNQNI